MPQSIFPLAAPVGLGTANYVWANIDCSPYIPSGATGVILYVWNNAGAVRPYGIRRTGSTDARVGDMSGNNHCWAMIGVDANRRFQFNNNTAFADKVWLILVGYAMAGVTFNTNAPAVSGSVGAAWTMIDLSALVPVGTIAVILEIFANALPTPLGTRMNGSTDNRVTDDQNRHNTFTIVMGVDANRRIEVYGNCSWYLTGYITNGVTFYTNAVNITPAAVGPWADCAALPVNSTMGFIEVICPAGQRYGLREDGSGISWYRFGYLHPWAIIKASADSLIEGIRENAATEFFLNGYAHYMPPVAQTDLATEVS